MRSGLQTRTTILMSIAVSPLLAAGWMSAMPQAPTQQVIQPWPATGGNQHREFPPPPKLEFQLRGEFPDDVPGALQQKSLVDIQHLVDYFAWQAIVACNWPVIDGLPGWADLKAPISKSGSRVWESWMDTNDIFLSNGRTPDPLHRYTKLPVGLLSQIRSGDHLLLSTEQAVKSDSTLPATLTDRNGHLIRYETRMNPTLFNFVMRRGLYSSAKQNMSTEAVNTPVGSVLVKAAWREIDPSESDRYYTSNAWICDEVNDKRVHWRRKRMGLLGFHIAQKTISAPQWIWSTFEHVDNDVPLHSVIGPDQINYGTLNTQSKRDIRNPIQRVRGVEVSTSEINSKMQSLLADTVSVLRNYRLISAQWPEMNSTGYSTNIGLAFTAHPAILANTTMESFVQETSSCIGCHSTARTARADKFVSSDFTFTLGKAEPHLVNSNLLTSAKATKSAWVEANWGSIARGRELTQRTYELLPKFTRSKVHCESCHLDAARNPDASWWVGMIEKYKYPVTQKLQARVNQCFQRSMNGKILSSKPDMQAFIDYMKWLDEVYATTRTGPPANAYPKVPILAGNSIRGSAIFVQKCSVCHGENGQGRYDHSTYYRPALWGKNSFNDRAGLMGKPDKMAAFLKSNMPFGSGGALSVQEAWDLTAYIGKQTRPGTPKPE